VDLTAALHNRIPGDTSWLAQATTAWNWFQNSGLINGSGLVNDGLTSSCGNNGQTVWTYNQGLAIGAAQEMYRATGDAGDLSEARYLADSAVNSPALVSNGLLTESCDALNATCDDNQKQFKGIFMRFLGELNGDSSIGGAYSSFIQAQTGSLWAADRTSLNQIGERWSGQSSSTNPNVSDWRTQASGLEALDAAP
jgi:predicted alpha-1,6-mannanase (GH76 family)